jgi:hypothetical protein
MLHGLGAELKPLPPDHKALFFEYNEFGAELPDFLREKKKSPIRPRLPQSRNNQGRASSAPREGRGGAFERPPWDSSPPERPTRYKNLEAVLPFKFLIPSELRALLSKALRRVRYAGLRVDKAASLTDELLAQADLRASHAERILDTPVLRELERHPSACTAQEAEVLESLDTLGRIARLVQADVNERRARLEAFSWAATHATGDMQRTSAALERRARGVSSRARADATGKTSALRHLPASAANDEEVRAEPSHAEWPTPGEHLLMPSVCPQGSASVTYSLFPDPA